MATAAIDALNAGLDMLNQQSHVSPRFRSASAPIVSRSLVNAGNEFEPQVFEQRDPGAEFGLSLLEQFGTKLPKPETTCLSCGSTASELPTEAETDRRYAAALATDLRAQGEVYSASLVERMQRQIDARLDNDDAVELGIARSRLLAAREKIAALREECLKLQASLDVDESVVSAFAEVSELLKDEKHFIAEVIDNVAEVNCKDADGFAVVDVASSLSAVPLSLEWEHEFLCDGGFNQHVTAQIEFRLVKTGRVPRGFMLFDVPGMTRLHYAVAIRQ